MQSWIVKSDPDTYAWADLVRDQETVWDGIHNYQARNFLRDMQPGDTVFVYHSQSEKAVVGVAKVVGKPYPDPQDDTWTVIKLAASHELRSPVPLEVMRSHTILKNTLLIRQSRLSVAPLTPGEARELTRLGK